MMSYCRAVIRHICAYLVVSEKKLVNQKGLTVHSTVQTEKSAFRKLLNWVLIVLLPSHVISTSAVTCY